MAGTAAGSRDLVSSIPTPWASTSTSLHLFGRERARHRAHLQVDGGTFFRLHSHLQRAGQRSLTGRALALSAETHPA